MRGSCEPRFLTSDPRILTRRTWLIFAVIVGACDGLLAPAPIGVTRRDVGCQAAASAEDTQLLAAVKALEAEVETKTKLQTDLERDLDAAITDATAAEAEMRTARTKFEEATQLAAKMEVVAQEKAKAASETKLTALRTAVDRAQALAKDAEVRTQSAKDSATAETRKLIALAETKAATLRDSAAPLRQVRDEQIDIIEEAARQKIAAIAARVAKRDQDKKKIRDATYAALAFAAVDGALLVGDRLHLGFTPAIVGAVAAVAAMIIFGTS